MMWQSSVEDVGFRSTWIRTLDNSLVSIPNNSVVNATVENLTLRKMFRERLVLQVTYDAARAVGDIRAAPPAADRGPPDH